MSYPFSIRKSTSLTENGELIIGIFSLSAICFAMIVHSSGTRRIILYRLGLPWTFFNSVHLCCDSYELVSQH